MINALDNLNKQAQIVTKTKQKNNTVNVTG